MRQKLLQLYGDLDVVANCDLTVSRISQFVTLEISDSSRPRAVLRIVNDEGRYYTLVTQGACMEPPAGCLQVCNTAEIDRYMDQVRDAAAKIQKWILGQNGEPLDLMRRMKFERDGFHPTLGHPLNVVEQINQTWAFVVALCAARHLLDMHPDAGGFVLAPGAHAAIELDIMSKEPGLVGAETFAAVNPANNKKLKSDLLKLSARTERHRYIFFMSPRFPGFKRLPQFESGGIQVWSVDV